MELDLVDKRMEIPFAPLMSLSCVVGEKGLIERKKQHEATCSTLIEKQYTPICDIIREHDIPCQDWISHFAVLPQELQKKIVMTMFDGNEKAAHLFLCAPFLYGITFYQEVKKEIAQNDRLFSPEKLPALFCMPYQSRLKYRQIACFQTFKSDITKILFDEVVYTESDLHDIKELEQEERDIFFPEKKIKVVELPVVPSNIRNCIIASVFSIAMTITTGSLGIVYSGRLQPLFITGVVVAGLTTVASVSSLAILYAQSTRESIREEEL